MGISDNASNDASNDADDTDDDDDLDASGMLTPLEAYNQPVDCFMDNDGDTKDLSSSS